MTTNRRKGEATLEIGGEDRVILFDFNAIAMLEEMHHGTPVHVLFDRNRFSVSVLRSAIYCALVTANPKRARKEGITLELVGKWLTQDAGRMEEIAEAIVNAAEAAMPGFGGADDDDDDKPGPTVPAPGPAAAAAPAPVTPAPAVAPAPSPAPVEASTTTRSGD